MSEEVIEKEEVIEDNNIDDSLTGKSPEELIELIKQKQKEEEKWKNKVHEVNEESKSRKLKLRKFEEEQERLAREKLEEEGNFKTIIDDLTSKYADYEELKSFKENAITSMEEKVEELKSRITKDDLEEYDLISDSLDISKKIKYLEKKANKKTDTINIDSTKSVGAGSGGNFPKTLAEMQALPSSEVRAFKDKRPADYRRIMSSIGNKQ
jgi:hypothetical protein